MIRQNSSDTHARYCRQYIRRYCTICGCKNCRVSTLALYDLVKIIFKKRRITQRGWCAFLPIISPCAAPLMIFCNLLQISKCPYWCWRFVPTTSREYLINFGNLWWWWRGGKKKTPKTALAACLPENINPIGLITHFTNICTISNHTIARIGVARNIQFISNKILRSFPSG